MSEKVGGRKGEKNAVGAFEDCAMVCRGVRGMRVGIGGKEERRGWIHIDPFCPLGSSPPPVPSTGHTCIRTLTHADTRTYTQTSAHAHKIIYSVCSLYRAINQQ